MTLPTPAARRAINRTRAGFGAFAFALPAGVELAHLDLFLDAERRFFERDLHVVTQIRPALPSLAINLRAATEEALENPGSAAATLRAAEDFAEDIERIVESAATGTGGCALRERGMPIAIVGCALVRIHQHVVRFAELLEAFFRARIIRVLIRVEFDRELAIRALDLVFGRLPLDREDLVIVALVLGGHGSSTS
jgi:hypothetical protein